MEEKNIAAEIVRLFSVSATELLIIRSVKGGKLRRKCIARRIMVLNGMDSVGYKFIVEQKFNGLLHFIFLLA